MINHFILTRFNITLWQKDKNGKSIDHERWLEKRLELFEAYCLPSVMGQTCQDFVWVMLVDADTPEKFRKRIKGYRDKCPQILLIMVKSGYGWRFADVFCSVVNDELKKIGAVDGDLCLTTYLDNDDILDENYAKTVREIASNRGEEKYFISFDYGKQYFMELDLTTRIKYPNNHFMTCVESVGKVRTCYGYGSHFMLEANKVADVYHVNDENTLLWTEVIHDKNVDNDVKMTLDTTVLSGSFSARCKFCLRAITQICRRTKDKIFGRKWE